MNGIGLYLHIPFCRRKCPYCDFFSAADSSRMEEYTRTLEQRIRAAGESLQRPADTLYFGGGTPSLLGEERLYRLAAAARESFGLSDAEVTVEVNPEKQDIDFERLQKGGFNRLSIGLQSADDRELQLLGRLHDVRAAERCIERAKQAGFENFSLDLMIATPGQTADSLMRSIDFCAAHGAKHISAYLLKIEPHTPYAQIRERLRLPDDDGQAELYELACQRLEAHSYRQYEISNFSLPGYESRHNLKYWHDEEYLGLGPSAHSFLDGRRFYCERSFDAFFQDRTVEDGEGGSPEEFLMLGLRLREGVTNARYRERFHEDIPAVYREAAERFNGTGLLHADGNGIRLTTKGFLVSNSLIAHIIG